MNQNLRNQLDGEELEYDVEAGWARFVQEDPSVPESPAPLATLRRFGWLVLLLVLGAAASLTYSKVWQTSSADTDLVLLESEVLRRLPQAFSSSATSLASPEPSCPEVISNPNSPSTNQQAFVPERPARIALPSATVRSSAMLPALHRPGAPSRSAIATPDRKPSQRVTSTPLGLVKRVEPPEPPILTTPFALAPGEFVMAAQSGMEASTPGLLTPKGGFTREEEASEERLSEIPERALSQLSLDELSLKPVALRPTRSRRHLRLVAPWTVGAMTGVGYEQLTSDFDASETPNALLGRTVQERANLGLVVRRRLLKRWGVSALVEASQRTDKLEFSESATRDVEVFNPEAYYDGSEYVGAMVLTTVSDRRDFVSYNRHRTLGVGLMVDYLVPTRSCDYSVFAGARYDILQEYEGSRFFSEGGIAGSDQFSELTERSPYTSQTRIRYLLGTRAETPVGEHLRLLLEARVTLGATYTIDVYDKLSGASEQGITFGLRVGVGYAF